jgi:hypothetical protein
LRDDGATVGNSLENRFPEYLTVTSCQDVSKSMSFQGIFNFGKSQKSEVLSQVNKMDGPFL